jgi:hypothetical protein
LDPINFNLEDKLDYALEEVEEGRKYYLRFTSIPIPPQTYHGVLKLKTNYSEKPEIRIRIRGRIREAKESSTPVQLAPEPSNPSDRKRNGLETK